MSGPTPTVVEYLADDAAAWRADELSEEQRSVLDTINQKVAARQSVEELVDFLFDATRAISPCDRVSIALVEEDGARLVSHYTRATYEPVLLKKGYAADLRGSSLDAVLNRGTPRLIHDLEAYLAEHPDSAATKLLVREGVRSSMTCPLAVEGRRVGVLFRSSRRARVYDAGHVRLHLAVAERLSQAVEKTWRIEQLRAANEAYFEMLGFVAHELKSPVASMLQSAQLMADGYVGPLTAEQRERLSRMVAKGEYLLRLVGDYLDLGRLESGQLELKARDDVDFVSGVVEPAIDIIAPQIEAQRMQLERHLPETPAPVQVDPDLMRIMMVNLLGNAAKYGNEGGSIRLTVAQPAGALEVRVWNEGPGFPPGERGRLFRKFSRLQTEALLRRKGTGVGLYTCWRIIQMHGGHIEADSAEGQWAEFRLTIPQPLPQGPAA
ncbi:MAG: GAF domain-containing sensor histidine kinase [Phycisphaerae bacterium]|jgi:signal transduction histidine kinase